MVRKTKTQSDACPSKNKDNNPPDEERKTFLVLSFPLIILFNIIKALLFELFIILKFVYNTSSRLLNKPTNPQETVNLEVVKGEETNKELDTMDLLAKQKYHHKRAFEFISQALKIDETQNPGNLIITNPYSTSSYFHFTRQFKLNCILSPLYGRELLVDDVIAFSCYNLVCTCLLCARFQ